MTLDSNSKNSTKIGWILLVWNFLSSLKLSLVLFVVTAIACLPGILIPQEQDPGFYLQNYGELGGSVLVFLDFHRVFHSTWFLVLVTILFVNLLACTIKRWRFHWHRALVHCSGAKTSLCTRIHFLGSPLIHTGVLLVLLGGILGGFFGVHHIYEIPVPGKISLPLKGYPDLLKVENFNIDYYPDGSPQQYRTQLKLVDDGKELCGKTISVNNPLVYRGLKVYQSSWGWMLDVTLGDGESSRQVQVKDRGILSLNKASGESLRVIFYPDYSTGSDGHPVSRTPFPRNPHLVYLQTVEGRPAAAGILGLNESAQLGENINLTFTGYRNFTGLHVKRDPGVPLVWAGFVFLTCGIPLRYLISSARRKGE